MKKGYCIHFNGFGPQSNTCGAGHKYLDVARDHTAEEITWHNENYPSHSLEDSAIASRTPCKAANGVRTCPDFCLPTQDELDEFEQRMDKEIKTVLKQFVVARPAITDYIKEVGKERESFADKIPCPICEAGTLGFTYAGSYNKHIHAKCSTDGCASWME